MRCSGESELRRSTLAEKFWQNPYGSQSSADGPELVHFDEAFVSSCFFLHLEDRHCFVCLATKSHLTSGLTESCHLLEWTSNFYLALRRWSFLTLSLSLFHSLSLRQKHPMTRTLSSTDSYTLRPACAQTHWFFLSSAHLFPLYLSPSR